MTGTRPGDVLDLLDWKRRIFGAYAEVREASDAEDAWGRWRAVRDDLIRSHPQSPLRLERRNGFEGLPFFDYDPSGRVLAEVVDAAAEPLVIQGSAGESFAFTRFATARFELSGRQTQLGLYWLDAYAGGLFVSFRDATSGSETYGACRYLLDTAKGADLGAIDGRLVLDFNFAYNPSCAYDPRWACPLAPPDNRLDVGIRAGERYP
jgi:uncharacterized protein